MGSYVPNTLSERKQMLDVVGVQTIDDLFGYIPDEVKLKKLNLPTGKSEMEVRGTMESLADRNTVFKTIFRGAGAYNHYIPAQVKSITSKEEFVTAYTPYQAEISQGILQSIFEYQTMICDITGMDVSNASHYDGATAAAESAAMCLDRKRNRVLVSACAHPHVIETIKTYCFGNGGEVVIVPEKDGQTDLSALSQLLSEQTACVYAAYPNFNGIIEDCREIAEMTHETGAKFIMGCNPIALAALKTPAECGADVAVGEGQPLGLPMSFGGPYLGFVACTTAMMRKIPGRIVGQTTDSKGNRMFVLTLQAREQHIRREKASSNICSNEALCAFTSAVYMTVMGGAGLREAASQCYSKAHYAAEKIAAIPGFALKYNKPFFHEFITECPIDKNELLAKLEEKGILGGLPVENGILWCVTETNTKEQIDRLCNIITEVCA